MSNDERRLQSLLRREFSLFLRHGFRELGGDGAYLHSWHIDAIIYVLTKVLSGEIRRLIITLPPRHLKSVIASTCWPAWLLGLNPALRIICASYGQDLAEKLARDCLRIMDAPFYTQAFPNVWFSRRSSSDFELTQGGGRLSTSLNGPITGRGADLIVIDDPLKAADVMSDGVRSAAIEWFTNVLMSRLNDQATGAIVLVMQRLHQNDLAGELLERGSWHELRLPAIAREEELIPIGGSRAYRRREGEALHPARQSLETLEAIRAEIGSIPFAAQYLQEPLPTEGNVVRAEWLQTYIPVELDRDVGQIVQSWDTAIKDDERHDWSVCITALVRRRQVYVLDVWRQKVEFTGLWRSVQSLARKWKPSALLIEDAGNGTALIQRLRNDQPPGVPSPLAIRPKIDKRSRLDAASSMIEAGDLRLPPEAPWVAAFRSELLGFPSTRHDDQVDALSQLLNWLDRRERNEDYSVAGPIFVREDGSLHGNVSALRISQHRS
jgi:predicted phage terminase large subunit-like protein